MTLAADLPVAYTLRLAVLLVALLPIACGVERSAPLKLSGSTMGTVWHVTVAGPPAGVGARELQDLIEARLDSLDRIFSTWRDDSELTALNRQPPDAALNVSPELFEVLLLSTETAWSTGGAFDVTVGPLVDLWGFGADGAVTVPPPAAEIEALLERVGYQHIVLDMASGRVQKRRDVSIDLSAIAKGYAVDQVAALLDAARLQNYLVEIGGELRLRGNSPRGGPWRVGIESPVPGGAASVQRAIALTDAALATSGDYRNFFEVDGTRYSHTLDPATGRPVEHGLASVTVVHESCATADALATALSVLGPERGWRLAREMELAAYFIEREGESFTVRYTESFAPLLD